VFGRLPLESAEIGRMKINWVLGNLTEFSPEIKIETLKNIGPFWGSWKTWRSCLTDNVICHDIDRASALLARKFQQNCNFYIPDNIYSTLNRPEQVKLYNGDFVDLELDNKEDIVALHLASAQSDIVLMMGFDLSPVEKTPDRLATHKSTNYKNLVKHAIMGNTQTQWVLLDHAMELDKDIQSLPNLSTDTLINSAKTLGIDL
jgi:hypothetical protein